MQSRISKAFLLASTLLMSSTASYAYLDTAYFSNNYTPAANYSIIKSKVSHKQFYDALVLLDKEIARSPNNLELYYQRASVEAELEKFYDSMDDIDYILMRQPHNEKALELRKIVLPYLVCLPKNEIGFGVNEFYPSDLNSYWTYESLHYYRFTKYGIFGGRLNHGNRYGQAGWQYQLEAYPKLGRKAYVEMIFAVSNTSQKVFPHYYASLEPYVSLPYNLEASIGYRGVEAYDKRIYTFTGSLGVYFGNYFFWGRPYYFTPETAKFFEIGLRRYFADANNYVAFRIGAGRYPDIGDAPPFNQIIVPHAYTASIEGKVAIHKNWYLGGNVGYAHEDYPRPSRIVRNLYSGGLELFWQF